MSFLWRQLHLMGLVTKKVEESSHFEVIFNLIVINQIIYINFQSRTRFTSAEISKFYFPRINRVGDFIFHYSKPATNGTNQNKQDFKTSGGEPKYKRTASR